MKTFCLSLLTGSLLLQPLAFADVSYQETTQVTGGSMMGLLKMAGAFSSQSKQLTQPVTSKVSIHGSQMVSANAHTTQIIDLDQQTITSIDHDKRTYSTVTFQQLEQQMTKMAAQLKGKQPPASGNAQMTFTAHITKSGATRQIDGQTASEALLTITMVSNGTDANNTKAGMAATSELWLVQDEPGMPELRSFNERMAKELSVDMASGMSSLLATQPGGTEALAELKKEAGKMTGIDVLQVTRVGVTADGQPLPPPSQAALPPVQNHGSTDAATPDTSGTAEQTQGSSMSRLGSFGRALSSSAMGGMVRHTNSNTPGTSGNGTDPATAGVLLENQTQTFGFSEAPVDAGVFQIPAGYKQVVSPMAK